MSKLYREGTRQVSYDNMLGMVDYRVWTDLMCPDNKDTMNRLKCNLLIALEKDITERQREYMIMYYSKGMTMEEIGKHFGVNKSTVSRTLKRGRNRLRRCLRYGARELLMLSDE